VSTSHHIVEATQPKLLSSVYITTLSIVRAVDEKP